VSGELSPELSRALERLAAAGIRLAPLPGVDSHFVLERSGFAVIAERREDTIGPRGASGRVTESGLAMLIWNGDQPSFVAQGSERPATPEEVAELRAFAAAVEQALAE